MAIAVSYLSEKIAPDWAKFSNQMFPHKPAITPQSPLGADQFRTNFMKGWTPARFAAEIAAPQQPLGAEPWLSIAKGTHVIKTKPVEPSGDSMFMDVFKGNYSGPKHKDDWAVIGQIRWEITVDEVSLGAWQKLDGLAMKVEVAEHRTGDGGNYRWIDPSYTTYPTIKLTRAATAKGCASVLSWIEAVQFGWTRGITAQIEGVPLESWAEDTTYFKLTLDDVMPIGWTGPQFNSEGKFATEVLELAHSGFHQIDDLKLGVTPAVPAGPPMQARPPVEPKPYEPVERSRATMLARGDTGGGA